MEMGPIRWIILLCFASFCLGTSGKVVSLKKWDNLLDMLTNPTQDKGDRLYKNPLEAGCKCTNGMCVNNGIRDICTCPTGWVYYYPDECRECGCGKGINCTREGGWMKTDKYCLCPDGKALKNKPCKDFCVDDPCENGGECENVKEGYSCNCPAGYLGLNCEIIDNEYDFVKTTDGYFNMTTDYYLNITSDVNETTDGFLDFNMTTDNYFNFTNDFNETTDGFLDFNMTTDYYFNITNDFNETTDGFLDFNVTTDGYPDSTTERETIFKPVTCGRILCVNGKCENNPTNNEDFKCSCFYGYSGVSCDEKTTYSLDKKMVWIIVFLLATVVILQLFTTCCCIIKRRR